MNPPVSALDRHLYAWLAEPDNQRFERAFNTYFTTAFPLLLRHLARLSRWDLANVEELAQDALLRFFEKVGRGRREASEIIKTSLVRIRPLNLGQFHDRQVNCWTHDTESFRDATMTFRLSPTAESDDVDFKRVIQALTGRIRPLQERADYLIQTIRIDLGWVIENPAALLSLPERFPAEAHEANELPNETHKAPVGIESEEFANSLWSEVQAESARAIAAERSRPGVTQFVCETATVVRHLPSLRVPTNGYLFEIALTVYLDECKKRGRRKRGGGGGGVRDSDCSSNADVDVVIHPIERLDAAFDGLGGVGEYFDPDLSRPAHGTPSTPSEEPSSDPTQRYEDAEFFEKFYAYLRRPLDEATDEHKHANSKGHAAAANKRLASLADKFHRTIAVLSLMGEGHTQEQIAERLNLSRNQVKYVIEQVQESYGRFAYRSDRFVAPPASTGVTSHV